ncbi:MAG: hypothetical protein AVDCRST_MAG87-2655, partial [uncultured Thermomicrobiales bacterium]
ARRRALPRSPCHDHAPLFPGRRRLGVVRVHTWGVAFGQHCRGAPARAGAGNVAGRTRDGPLPVREPPERSRPPSLRLYRGAGAALCLVLHAESCSTSRAVALQPGRAVHRRARDPGHDNRRHL